MTSAVRLSVYIAISMALHLLLFNFDYQPPRIVSHPQKVSFGYTSTLREKFVAEKKAAPNAAPSKQATLTNNTPVPRVNLKPKQEVLKQKKSDTPVAQAASPAPVKKTMPTDIVTTHVERSSSNEVHVDADPSLQTKTAESVSVIHGETVPKALAGAKKNLQKSSSLDKITDEPELTLSHGGKKGFTAALPRYDRNPKPVYPEVARRRGWEGSAHFEVLVLKNGRVGQVKMLTSSGHRSLDRAARKAIQRWVFKAASSFGANVDSRVVVPIDFVLNQ